MINPVQSNCPTTLAPTVPSSSAAGAASNAQAGPSTTNVGNPFNTDTKQSTNTATHYPATLLQANNPAPAAGGSSSSASSDSRASVAPVKFTSPADGTVIHPYETVTFKGTANPNAEVVLHDPSGRQGTLDEQAEWSILGRTTADANGNWQIDYTANDRGFGTGSLQANAAETVTFLGVTFAPSR
ncbi:hypothetical protein [Dyella nitratireducens]|uniref:Bacterial Ig-like domain-containing protein n=1 Tax=Dyella nitratireducens TaxID=1849580 RepID=A0ABQ1GHK6_9GAMM|nr:hypothetical protein [Dyella nitratireducens]GGA43765.1 hypothetical protein GCM10010981_36110 [Dyella nitratireducens]GLQ41832.1 hypothetical protein GCM10007902_16820 [Dyella nitratireducens]